MVCRSRPCAGDAVSFGIFALACRRITMQPVRHALVACALLLATTVAAALLLIETAVARTADRIALAGPSLVVSRVDAGGWAAMPVSAADVIARIPGVRSSAARVWGVLPGPPTLTIIADPALGGASGEIICGRGVPGAMAGAAFSIRALDGAELPARVRSLLDEETDTLAYDVAYAPAPLASRALLLDSDHATDIAVESVRPEEDDALVRDLAAGLGYPVRVVTRAQMRGVWQTRAGMRGTLRLMALTPALLTVLLLAAALAMGGSESRRDAGKLKLAGWQTRDVAWLFALQSMSICTASVGLGLVVAYVLVIPLGAGPLLGPLFGWTTSTPHLILDAGGAVQVLLLVGGIMMVPILGASLLPAWRAARIDPADLLEAP